MRPHQYIGLIMLIAGASIAFGPKFFSTAFKPSATPSSSIQDSERQVMTSTSDDAVTRVPQSIIPSTTTTISINHQDHGGQVETSTAVVPDRLPSGDSVGTKTASLGIPTQGPQTKRDDFIDILAKRALREAEAAALRASNGFRKEMMAPLKANDRSFAEKLYSIGANAKAISKNESEYRKYVAERFYEELARGVDIQKNLDAVTFEYLNRLDRIANQTIIKSGLDVTNMPTVTLTIKDFDNLLRAEIRESVGQTSSNMQRNARQGMAIQSVSLGIGLLMPTTFLVDLTIGLGLDTTANSFRDPLIDVKIDAHNAAEQLADRICFGTEQKQGLYAALLDIANYQNHQLKRALRQSESISEPESLNAVFSDNP